MFALQKSKSKTSARQQIAIKGVRDGILILPNNEYRAILQVSSLNFELRSEEEQDAIIDMIEGLVFKRRNAKLEIGNTENNNTKSQVKCRKATKLYRY